MKKRIFSILLCLCMVLLLLPMTALAESEGSFEYSISATSEVTITGYTGSAAEIAIPDTIDSKPVTSIGNRAFENCSNLTSVTIPDSVTSIGDFAFLACAGLKSITIPDSVTSIGDSAFYQCFGLDSLIIPDSVTSIGNGTFKYCGGLTSISISDKITSIGKGTFYYCRKLTSVNIPNGVTSIGNEAFFTCESLTSISIPASVTSIGNEAFKYCGGLTSIDIPDSVTSIGNEAFKYCGGLESIFLPEGLDVTSASIPNTTSQVKYSLDAEKGEVTITGITLGTDNTSVAIPATICGYPVTSVSDDSLLTIISSHTCAGGQATCQNKAICGICKQEYGEPAAHTAGNDDGDCSTPVYCIYHPDTVVVAAKSHDFSGDWNNDGTGHWHVCQNDGCTVAEPKIPHSGTDDGDCTTAVICECGYVITAANAKHTYGEWQSNSDDTHTRYCTVEGCNGYEDGDCEGGQASYFKKAVCDECNEAYGELLTDKTAPTGEISIGTNKWNSFLDTITFGLFFKDTQSVTVTAADDSYDHDGYTDDKAVKVAYYLHSGDTVLTKEDLASKEFTIYDGGFNINPDNKYVVYARLTDHAGNVTYISSNGIVLDSVVPVISGIENGKTYCEEQTFTVSEKYIKSVTVNGTEVTLDENNQFTLSPAEGTQTIVVTDKAGNETSVTVTVNDGHTAGNDDGDCSTPVYCIYHPDTVVVAAKSHDFSGEWHNDGTGHWHICQNDGCTVAETETPHSGTDDGDCTTAVICECGYVITAANAEHSYGEWQSNGNNTHTRRCTVTGCNGYEDGNCTGGTATCTSKAICEYCKTEYGELANHSLSKTDAKDATCTEDGNTAYWTCSVCHKLFSDEDGTNETMLDAVTIKAAHKLTKTEAKDATCTEDGNTAYWTCSVCHKLFSDEKGTIETTLEAVTIKAAHKLTKTEARNATVTETGNIEYWQCQDCGDIFSDPDGKNEITLEDTVIAKLPPKIIEGTGQSVTAGEKKALSFKSNAAFSDFIRVELDGKTLDEKNYTVKEGSTVVTLKADYVATLSAGEHTIGIVSTNGTATTTFTVNAKAVVDNDTKSPQTGDNSHMALWIALLFMSGAGVIGTMVYGKKKRAK